MFAVTAMRRRVDCGGRRSVQAGCRRRWPLARRLTYAWHQLQANTRHQSPYQPPSARLSSLLSTTSSSLKTPTLTPTTPSTTKVRVLRCAQSPCACARLNLLATCQMSASQKVQQHPAFIQAQDKANYYVNQLDKEVRPYLSSRSPRARCQSASVQANHTTAIASSPSTRL